MISPVLGLIGSMMPASWVVAHSPLPRYVPELSAVRPSDFRSTAPALLVQHGEMQPIDALERIVHLLDRGRAEPYRVRAVARADF